jgi:transposase InsO family protein
MKKRGSRQPENIKEMRAQKLPFRCHSFDLARADLNIEHRITKSRHPWTNGQVERMNRTIKEATVKRYYYEEHDQLRHHLTDFSSPTTSPDDSRPRVASRPTKPSVKHGQKSHNDSS